jgi:antitoxin MazE
MKAKLIQIGNSKGIRIPKSVLEQCDFEEDVKIEVRRKKLIVYSDKKARKNWDAEFKNKTASVKDRSLAEFNRVSTDWESKEWEW